jgi:hypothetical protein
MANDTTPGPQDDVVSLEAGTDSQTERDRDGVASLRDTQEESGDEEEVDDTFDLDEREAREVGVALDGGTDDEPRLD